MFQYENHELLEQIEQFYQEKTDDWCGYVLVLSERSKQKWSVYERLHSVGKWLCAN